MLRLVADWIPPHPLLLLVGQSPGRVEDREGVPFVGPAGQELRLWLRGVGLDDVNDCAYANIDQYFHPDDPNHVPSKKEAEVGYERVRELVTILRPAAVVLLGASAAHMALPGAMTAIHGREVRLEGIPTLICYHPSYVIRTMNTGERARRAGECVQVLRRAVAYARGEEVGVELPNPVEVEELWIDEARRQSRPDDIT